MNSPDPTPKKKTGKRPLPKKGSPFFKGGLEGLGVDANLVMAKDALAIAKELENLKGPGISQKQRQDAISRLNRRARSSAQTCRIRLAGAPRPSYPPELPISSRKDDIVEAIKKNQVVVITGETGSGKTTQIPKMCIEAGQGTRGMIGCTQPRRIAAVTVARRIAQELLEEPGKSVGYKIRFDEVGTRRKVPYIKVMTDGILLAETQQDPLLAAYDTIIVDEAHERSANIDFVLGILRSLAPKRPDLKIVITSATLDTEKFSQAFDNAPIIEVSGRMYPVETVYFPVEDFKEEAGETNFVEAAASAVDMIFAGRGPMGDILVFMPTAQDILETCELIAGRNFPGVRILPLYAALPGPEQARVFEPHRGITVTVATNVAETSLTLPNIKFVVDTGLARILRYNPGTRTTSLPIERVSQASADQRKGRCGRVQNGLCLRLYDEKDFLARPRFTPPEILRSNLAQIILRMISLNLGDVKRFPFVDRPKEKSIADGFAVLEELSAIESGGRKGQPVLTKTGRIMARLPIDPRIARILLASSERGCLAHALVVAAALATQDCRLRPPGQEGQADAAHARFVDTRSDFVTLINIWNGFFSFWKEAGSANQARKFCKEHFLSFRRMREWRDIWSQLFSILAEENLISGKPPAWPVLPPMDEALYAALHQSVTAGYLSQVAFAKEGKNLYLAAKGREVMLFPGSGLFNRGGTWIVAAEMVETSRLFARMAACIDPKWLEELAGNLVRTSFRHPRFDPQRGEVVADARLTLFGLPIVEGRTVRYGPVRPEEASSIFIEQALVQGRMRQEFGFLEHNKKLRDKILRIEEKLRQRDILVPDEAISDFYRQRLGGVFDVASLKKRIKDLKGDKALKMSEQDLLLDAPDWSHLAQFPDQARISGENFRLRYTFAPGKDDDGATLVVPQSRLANIAPEAALWVVPGFLEEKVEALLRGLEKKYRKQLVPVKDKAGPVARLLKPESQAPLASQLSEIVHELFGVAVPAQAWPVESLPDYLKTRILLVDHQGRQIAAARDVSILADQAKEHDSPAPAVWQKAVAQWEKPVADMSQLPDLPQSLTLAQGKGGALMAYPGLWINKKDGVQVKLFQNPQQAQKAHLAGVSALLQGHFKKELKLVEKNLALSPAQAKAAMLAGGAASVETAVLERLFKDLFEKDIRSIGHMEAHALEIGPRLGPHALEKKQEAQVVLNALAHAHGEISGLKAANEEHPPVVAFLSQRAADLQKLVPQRFMLLYDSGRIAQLPRYLKAVTVRAQRGVQNLTRDKAKQKKASPFEEALQKAVAGLGAQSSEHL
ncbi:MAG: ATP-dependent RNA helicase HrpA, partial [Desulfatibacillaceae bacterium]|nr:ATP-dependent RNA helicase HrpA [Desulfatibacillaceae bacterium]